MKVLISRCLLGHPCRYDGRVVTDIRHLLIQNGVPEEAWIPVCPEVEGGLSTPRLPSEISAGNASDVLNGRARVLASDGTDNTAAFMKGASIAAARCRTHSIRVALLKSKSPSCGCGKVYDGTFSGCLKDGDGLTTQVLRPLGVRIFNEHEIELLSTFLKAGNDRDC